MVQLRHRVVQMWSDQPRFFVLLHNAALDCTAQQSHRARYTRIGCASAHRRTRHRPAR